MSRYIIVFFILGLVGSSWLLFEKYSESKVVAVKKGGSIEKKMEIDDASVEKIVKETPTGDLALPILAGAVAFEGLVHSEMSSQSIPAASVVVFDEGKILYEKYFGKSNLQYDIPLASDHVFLLASISKVVTATALLQLYDDGKFALDDNINEHLPFDVRVPDQTTGITFRMLLTHTSGIADGSALDDQYYYGEDSPVALDFFLENYLTPGGEFYSADENFHNFEPGAEHEYSNVGNALIGVLVQEISGLDFNTYTKENIFAPLGMTDSYWRLDEVPQTIVTPYDYEDGQYEAAEQYTFTDYPNGGLRSTGRDMFLFLRSLMRDDQSLSPALLAPSTVQAMITPQISSIDDEVGLHLFLMNVPTGLWGHDGAEQGVATIMAFNPETKVGAIILTNQGEADLDGLLAAAYQLGL